MPQGSVNSWFILPLVCSFSGVFKATRAGSRFSATAVDGDAESTRRELSTTHTAQSRYSYLANNKGRDVRARETCSRTMGDTTQCPCWHICMVIMAYCSLGTAVVGRRLVIWLCEEYRSAALSPRHPSRTRCYKVDHLNSAKIHNQRLKVANMQLRSGTVIAPLSPSQVHFSKTHCKIKFLGKGDNGETWAAVSKTDAKRLMAEHGQRTQAFYDALREKLVAVKFYLSSNLEGDSSNEIKFLAQAFTTRHPRITPCIDSHLAGGTQWLSLPFCSGGSLGSLMDKHAGRLSISFVWHVGLQLAEAVSLLLYRIEDCEMLRRSAGDLPSALHGDIWDGNTLVRPSNASNPGFKDFPNLVLADFGRAQELRNGDPKSVRRNHAYYQLRDIESVGRTMSFLRGEMVVADPYKAQGCHDAFAFSGYGCKNGTCQNCSESDSDIMMLSSVTKLESLSSRTDDIAGAFATLTEFMTVARHERAQTYRALPAVVSADLNAIKVTNEELAIALG